jgi:hypothetical protein
MCIPGSETRMMLREEPRQDDQSLTQVAVYASEACLVKMLYRAAFAAVYTASALPDHDDFRETPEHARRRTVLFASATPVWVPGLELVLEPRGCRDPWARDAGSSKKRGLGKRMRRFLERPTRQKYVSVARRARQLFPELPISLRLPFGAWWLAENSALDQALLSTGLSERGWERRELEKRELRFVGRFL